MILHNRSIVAFGAIAVLTGVFGSSPMLGQDHASSPKLNDPTIVAIFDAANT
ncbi:MAG: hypothetical protein PVSMB1_01040 [Gemmatimonadaceae bacterium]